MSPADLDLVTKLEARAKQLIEESLTGPDGELVSGLFEFANRVQLALRDADIAVSVNEIRRGKKTSRTRNRVTAARAIIRFRKTAP
jgi:hypothetical protein